MTSGDAHSPKRGPTTITVLFARFFWDIPARASKKKGLRGRLGSDRGQNAS